MGNRNDHAPAVAASLAAEGVRLLAPYRSVQRDPCPAWSALLSRFRYLMDTLFGQVTERSHAKRVWARATWHIGSRLLRQILGHTVAEALTREAGYVPLQLARLVSLQ